MKYKKKEGVVIQNHDAYSLILQPEGEKVLVVTPSAAFILENCTGLNSIDDLERKTLRHFSLPIMTPLVKDLQEILDEFEKHQLVEKV